MDSTSPVPPFNVNKTFENAPPATGRNAIFRVANIALVGLVHDPGFLSEAPLPWACWLIYLSLCNASVSFFVFFYFIGRGFTIRLGCLLYPPAVTCRLVAELMSTAVVSF